MHSFPPLQSQRVSKCSVKLLLIKIESTAKFNTKHIETFIGDIEARYSHILSRVIVAMDLLQIAIGVHHIAPEVLR